MLAQLWETMFTRCFGDDSVEPRGSSLLRLKVNYKNFDETKSFSFVVNFFFENQICTTLRNLGFPRKISDFFSNANFSAKKYVFLFNANFSASYSVLSISPFIWINHWRVVQVLKGAGKHNYWNCSITFEISLIRKLGNSPGINWITIFQLMGHQVTLSNSHPQCSETL